MSDEINIGSFEAGGKSSLSYETVFNLHVIKTNQQMQNTTSQRGVGIPVIMGMIASIMAMDGLIKNGEKMKKYKEEVESRMLEIETDMHGLGDATTDDKKFVDIWWKILKCYNFQLTQMYSLGLAPAEDEDDIMPTIKERIEQFVEVPQWKPAAGDFDYKKDLGIQLTKDEEKFNKFQEEIIQAQKEMNQNANT